LSFYRVDFRGVIDFCFGITREFAVEELGAGPNEDKQAALDFAILKLAVVNPSEGLTG